MRYTLTLILTLALLFTLQGYALRLSGGRTTKSESNFFSSIGRIQAASRGKSDVILLGSSVTGRLPDRAQGVPGVANMGCDGGSAVDALRAIDRGILPTAPWLVIEANTLHLALNPKPTEISAAMSRPWFKVGMKVPYLAAYARPAAFLYSKLLERKMGGYSLEPGEDLGVKSLPTAVRTSAQAGFSERENELICEIEGIISRQRSKGSRILIVWLPPGHKDFPPPPWILEIARRTDSPWWNLGSEAQAGTVILTDGYHMAAPTAVRTINSLLMGISRQPVD